MKLTELEWMIKLLEEQKSTILFLHMKSASKLGTEEKKEVEGNIRWISDEIIQLKEKWSEKRGFKSLKNCPPSLLRVKADKWAVASRKYTLSAP
jgi:hypothetical protein